MDVVEKLFSLATDDYQDRGGNYPRSGIPDTIDVYVENNVGIVVASFKNTSERDSSNWLTRYVESMGYVVEKIFASQDGDFHDDWVIAEVHVSIQ